LPTVAWGKLILITIWTLYHNNYLREVNLNSYLMSFEEPSQILAAISASIASIVAGVLAIFIKNKFDVRVAVKEDKEIKEEVNRVVNLLENEKDVLSLMIKNVSELREYYVINKQQARNSFSAALFISILGFLLFASGIIISYSTASNSTIQYTTVGGAIVETIAGLFFWLYSKALTQINLFHTSLLKTEKFLTAIQLVDRISENNRDQTYSFIIANIINAQVMDEPKSIKLPSIRSSKAKEKPI
jgi:hypothetical protein